MTKSSFVGKGERSTECLGLIYFDVCGPMNVQAIGGFSYFIMFIDDHSMWSDECSRNSNLRLKNKVAKVLIYFDLIEVENT